MSIAVASAFGFLVILLMNATANGSLIHLLCQNPNSELCRTVVHRLNVINRFNAELSELNSRYSITEEDQEDEFEELANPSRTNEELLRCINLGNDNCNNGSLPGSGKDDDYLVGGGNPGKRSQSNIGITNDGKHFGRRGNVGRHKQ